MRKPTTVLRDPLSSAERADSRWAANGTAELCTLFYERLKRVTVARPPARFRSCALVGSGGILSGSGSGAAIDAHEAVIRFNDAPLKGFTRDVGNRTTIRVVSGQHLLGLINDVLDLSRIEAGRFQITEEDVDIVQLAEDCRRIVEIRAQAQRVKIVSNFEPDLPIVFGDARALRQTWINLLTNAVKFSPPDSEVLMFAQMEAGGEMRFGIHDNGPGIAESEIEKVLHAFTQGASGLAQPGKGSGLGLSIVKGLLAVHGGRFELKSQYGQGTQAECVLPPQRLRTRPSMARRA